MRLAINIERLRATFVHRFVAPDAKKPGNARLFIFLFLRNA
jgi:hypothetical protein